MPTPSGPLHVGRAWLLLITAAFIHEARRRGQAAELTLVFDTRVSRYYGRSDAFIAATGEQIIADICRLGITVERVLTNENAAIDDHLWQTERAALAAEFGEDFSRYALPPHSFLDNARLDRQLGVTHLVRGNDRRSYRSNYATCYRALGYAEPTQVYLPLVRDANGVKMAAGSPCRVSELLDAMSLEQLTRRLIETCVERDAQRKFVASSTGLSFDTSCQEWVVGLDRRSREDEKEFESYFVGVPCWTFPAHTRALSA